VGRGTRAQPAAVDSVSMNELEPKNAKESGKVGYALMWLLGVPLPILLIIYFLRGCN
jgi:hypothetical protein